MKQVLSRFLKKDRLMAAAGQQQVSTWTAFDRYPSIFEQLPSLIGARSDVRVLSFGCSSGEELETLDCKYFKGVTLHGVDIDQGALMDARARKYYQNNVEIFEYSAFSSSHEQYDLIVAMSVLCRWPQTKGKEKIGGIYPFSEFERTTEMLDRRLKVGGCIVIYNANYFFEDTKVFHQGRYDGVVLNHQEDEFVTKFTRAGERAAESGPFRLAFRKIK
jgi:SAM-dependent methyltransferase